MGAWLYVKPRIDMAVRLMCESGGRVAREVVYIGRAASAAKTTASPDIHQAETIDLCRQALALTDQHGPGDEDHHTDL
jgi:2-oxoglutarate dehydrogenase complex dehydrogenase (E1) component-like enzyme